MNRLLPSTQLLGSHIVRIAYVRPLFDQMVSIGQSSHAYDLIKEQIPNQIDYKETFWVLFLSNANRLLDISQVGCGTVRQTLVNIPEIFQLALLLNATGLILVHNHPSGNTKPSATDLTMTNSLQQGCKHLGLQMLDHLIITTEGYLSMADQGLI